MATILCLVKLLAVLSYTTANRPTRQESDITYKTFHVESSIVSRYAITTVTSVVVNGAEESKELDFRVQLPDTAFISNFSMSVNGRTFYGVAKEKKEAAEEFQERIMAGENVGLVESRGTELFLVRINTAANSEARFVLQYEELIVRRRSKYQQVLNLNPGAVVDDLRVEVRVVDLQGVIEETASQFVTTDRVSQSEVVFSYSPSVQQQQEDSPLGLARDLTVEYDVVHSSDGGAGEFVVDSNCYFAQFFSPSGVAAVPVDLVFVIDVSGSMSGTKIEQTIEALETIINQLRSGDRFTMLTFSDSVSYWQEKLVSVSEYRTEGVQFAQGLQATGGTNFNQGLLDGASVLKTHGMSEHVPLLVILTDGQPTSGVTNENTIVENAVNALSGTAISLNCLGFGFDLNFNLLERLALKNNGIVRRIYEGEDAPQQLEGFFEEISSPVLRDIRVLIDSQSVSSISDTNFPILYDGGEIVVAGQLVCDESDPEIISVEVVGMGSDKQVNFHSNISTHPTNAVSGYAPSPERLLAYLMIQQLLLTKFTQTDSAVISANEERALQLSLYYNFVTELTSLIVVEETFGSGKGNESNIGETNQGGGGAEEDFGFHPAFVPTNAGQVPVDSVAKASGASVEVAHVIAVVGSMLVALVSALA